MPAARTTKTPIPADFTTSERVRTWAAAKGHDRLDEHLENFTTTCQANGYRYADWDAAFMNAIRHDWARLSRQPHRRSTSSSSPSGTNSAAQWLSLQADANRTIDHE